MNYKNIPLLSVIIISLFVLFACGESGEKSNDARPISGSSSLNEEQRTAIENAVFEDFDGNTIALSDFRGKTVLIDFWETWCAPCLASMPTLDRLMQDFPDDFVVLATSPLWTDTKEDVRRFMSQHDYSFYYVHANELATKLAIRGIPYKVYVAPDGTFYKDEAGSRGADQDYRSISQVIEKLREGS